MQAILRRLFRRIVPVLGLCGATSCFDPVNIGFAGQALQAASGVSAAGLAIDQASSVARFYYSVFRIKHHGDNLVCQYTCQ